MEVAIFCHNKNLSNRKGKRGLQGAHTELIVYPRLVTNLILLSCTHVPLVCTTVQVDSATDSAYCTQLLNCIMGTGSK